MKTLFLAHAGGALDGSLIYVVKDHAFRFDAASPAAVAERAGDSGVTSLAIGTLQIEIGVGTHLTLFAWGLHPRARWLEGRLGEPGVRAGTVELLYPSELRPGVSLSLAEVNAWATVYDPDTGWLRIVPPTKASDDEHVLIATGVALGLQSNGELASIWLHPVLD